MNARVAEALVLLEDELRQEVEAMNRNEERDR